MGFELTSWRFVIGIVSMLFDLWRYLLSRSIKNWVSSLLPYFQRPALPITLEMELFCAALFRKCFSCGEVNPCG